MFEFIQIVTILGASVLEIERFRGAPQTDLVKLLSDYPFLFKLLLSLCSISYIICSVVWALQPNLLWIVGWGLLLMSSLAAIFQLSGYKFYKAVWYVRLDAFFSLGFLGLAMYLKVKELF